MSCYANDQLLCCIYGPAGRGLPVLNEEGNLITTDSKLDEGSWASDPAVDEKGSTRVVILDMSNLMNIDTSGIHALKEVHKELVSLGMELAIVNPSWLVIHKLKVAQFVDKIGGLVFLTAGEAVDVCLGSKIGSLKGY